MKTIYKKELKTYLTNILTYIFVALILLVFLISFTDSIFNTSIYNIKLINYELPIYKLFVWFITLIPILIFLNFSIQKKKRIDTNLYTSDISSFKIILAKIFAITTVFLIVLLLILITNIILILTIYKSSAMTLSIYILAILLILLSASFTTMIYICIRNPIIALIISVLLQNLVMIFTTLTGYLEKIFFLPYLQGLVPVATILIYICLIILFTAISVLILNYKRNIK